MSASAKILNDQVLVDKDVALLSPTAQQHCHIRICQQLLQLRSWQCAGWGCASAKCGKSLPAGCNLCICYYTTENSISYCYVLVCMILLLPISSICCGALPSWAFLLVHLLPLTLRLSTTSLGVSRTSAATLGSGPGLTVLIFCTLGSDNCKLCSELPHFWCETASIWE